jgi:hypothetical protein
MLQVSDSPQNLLDALDEWQPSIPPKWAEQKPS